MTIDHVLGASDCRASASAGRIENGVELAVLTAARALLGAGTPETNHGDGASGYDRKNAASSRHVLHRAW